MQNYVHWQSHHVECDDVYAIMKRDDSRDINRFDTNDCASDNAYDIPLIKNFPI